VRRRRRYFPGPKPRIYEHGHHLFGFRPVAWRLRPRPPMGILSGIEGIPLGKPPGLYPGPFWLS